MSSAPIRPSPATGDTLWWKKPAQVSFPVAPPLFALALASGAAARSFFENDRPVTCATFYVLSTVLFWLGWRSDGCCYDSRIYLMDNLFCWIFHTSRILDNMDSPRKLQFLRMFGPPFKNPAHHDHTTVHVSDDCSIEVFRPKGAVRQLPILLYFHGGGHCVGNALKDPQLMMHLKQFKGDVIIARSVYRKAPEHPFPAAADDAIASLEYVSQHAAELGGSVEDICLGGISAGGNLAAVALHHAAEKGIPVRHVCLFVPEMHVNCGMHQSYAESGRLGALPSETLIWFMKAYCPVRKDATNPRCSPALAEKGVLQKVRCGIIVVTASADPLRDSGCEYVEALQAAGVEVAHYMLRGSHSFAHSLDTGTMAQVNATWRNGMGIGLEGGEDKKEN